LAPHWPRICHKPSQSADLDGEWHLSRGGSPLRQSGSAWKMLRDGRIALRRRRSDRFPNTRILGRRGTARRFTPPAPIPHPHVRPPVDERSPVPEPHPRRHASRRGDAPLGGSHAQPGFTRRVESILRAMECPIGPRQLVHVTADPRHLSWERRSSRSSLYPGLFHE
jgi:hypothetical protein